MYSFFVKTAIVTGTSVFVTNLYNVNNRKRTKPIFAYVLVSATKRRYLWGSLANIYSNCIL